MYREGNEVKTGLLVVCTEVVFHEELVMVSCGNIMQK